METSALGVYLLLKHTIVCFWVEFSIFSFPSVYICIRRSRKESAFGDYFIGRSKGCSGIAEYEERILRNLSSDFVCVLWLDISSEMIIYLFYWKIMCSSRKFFFKKYLVIFFLLFFLCKYENTILLLVLLLLLSSEFIFILSVNLNTQNYK